MSKLSEREIAKLNECALQRDCLDNHSGETGQEFAVSGVKSWAQINGYTRTSQDKKLNTVYRSIFAWLPIPYIFTSLTTWVFPAAI